MLIICKWIALKSLRMGRRAHVCISNKKLTLSEQQGAALLQIAPEPPGKGQEKNKNPLSVGDFYSCSIMLYKGSCSSISSTIGCVDRWRDVVDYQGTSSLFLLSPLIPCYPKTHRSSVTLGNGRNISHICLIPPTCLPVHLKAIPFFVVALKHGHVVLCSSGERLT